MTHLNRPTLIIALKIFELLNDITVGRNTVDPLLHFNLFNIPFKFLRKYWIIKALIYINTVKL